MKRHRTYRIRRLWIALGLLVLPVLVRTLWFYRGIYSRTTPVAGPDYASLSAPTPPLSTPQLDRVSVEAQTDAKHPREKVVLFDQVHENRFDVLELETLTRQFSGYGARMEIILPSQYPSETALNDRFRYASAYVVVAPQVSFKLEEVLQVQRFVERGGRLVVIVDPTRTWEDDDITAANSLLAPFDLSFSNDYVYNMLENEGNYRNVLFREFAENPLTEGLEMVAFYAARSVSTATGLPLVRGDEHTLSSLTDQTGNLAVMALGANEKVLAIGDLTFFTPPYNQVADNSRLIAHLAEFILEGERVRDLTDLPFIFNRSLAVLPTSQIELTAEALEIFGSIQAPLRLINLSMSMVEEPVQGSDLVVLGLYTPTRDLLPYLGPFGLDMSRDPLNSNDEADLYLPGFGEVARTDTGLMLLSQADSRTTLVLLAETQDALINLVMRVVSGDLSSCIVQDTIGACRVGARAEEDEEGAATPAPTPLPSPTPPPSLTPPPTLPPPEPLPAPPGGTP